MKLGIKPLALSAVLAASPVFAQNTETPASLIAGIQNDCSFIVDTGGTRKSIEKYSGYNIFKNQGITVTQTTQDGVDYNLFGFSGTPLNPREYTFRDTSLDGIPDFVKVKTDDTTTTLSDENGDGNIDTFQDITHTPILEKLRAIISMSYTDSKTEISRDVDFDGIFDSRRTKTPGSDIEIFEELGDISDISSFDSYTYLYQQLLAELDPLCK